MAGCLLGFQAMASFFITIICAWRKLIRLGIKCEFAAQLTERGIVAVRKLSLEAVNSSELMSRRLPHSENGSKIHEAKSVS